MSKINNGGPAVPCGLETGHMATLHNGMTMRDYFAAKAMGAILAGRKHDISGFLQSDVAEDAYAYADAMLAARQPAQEGCPNCGDTGIHACIGKPANPMADGWIEWNGGECPVPANTVVQIKMRDGYILQGSYRSAWRYVWEKRNRADDIIAYRVVEGGAA